MKLNFVNLSALPVLVVITLPFIFGIIFSYWLPLNFIYLTVISLILLLGSLVLIKKELSSNVFLFGVIFFLGALSYQNSQILPQNNISNFITQERNQAWLKARVHSQIDTRYTYNKRKSTFLLEVLAIEDKGSWQPVSGKVRATLFMEYPDFEFADTLVLKGEIYQPGYAKDKEDKFDYREYLARRGIFGIFQVKPETIDVVYRSRNPLKYIFRIKDKLRRIINHTLPQPQRAILSALLLGDRGEIPREIKESFIKTGTVHILAISGLHVGLISYILYLFLKIMRIPLKFSYFMLILLIISYAVLTGANTPVIRATIMAVVYLVGLILWRKHDILNTLALSALLILGFRPQQLFDTGFQLSFISVLSIITLTPQIERLLLRRPSVIPDNRAGINIIYEKAKNYIIKALIVSFSAWLGIVPIIGYHFRIITPVAIFANLLVIPLVFLILAVGFVTLLSGMFSFFLAQIFSGTNLLCVTLLVKISILLSKISFGAVCTRIFSSPPVIFVYYFALIALFAVINVRNAKLLSGAGK